MTPEQRIERFIVDELLVGSTTTLDHHESLISSGVLDSLTLLQLVDFIERKFWITIEDEEVVPENFQTINTMTAFIEEKQLSNGQ